MPNPSEDDVAEPADDKKPKKALSLQQKLLSLRNGKEKVEIGKVSEHDFTVRAISTGNIQIDGLTGIGGFPRGRITENFGPPSSGKTTSALQAAAKVIAEGGSVLFLDYEKTLDPGYCAALGIDIDSERFIVMRPRSFEEGANVFRDLCATGELDMMIADSVAAMVTEKELTSDTGTVSMMDRAKMMHQFCRQIVDLIARTHCAVIMLNHVLEVVDVTPMGQQLARRGIVRKTTPGGAALKFYSSLRIEFKQVGNIRSTRYNALTNESEDVIAQTKVQATVVKNKVGDPFRTAELRVRYGHGFSQPYSIMEVLLAHKAIRKETGGVYRFTEATQPKGRDPLPYIKGEDVLLGTWEEDAEWLAQLESVAIGLLNAHGMDMVDATGYDPETGDSMVDEQGQTATSEDIDAALGTSTSEEDGLTVDKTTGEIL